MYSNLGAQDLPTKTYDRYNSSTSYQQISCSRKKCSKIFSSHVDEIMHLELCRKQNDLNNETR